LAKPAMITECRRQSVESREDLCEMLAPEPTIFPRAEVSDG